MVSERNSRTSTITLWRHLGDEPPVTIKVPDAWTGRHARQSFVDLSICQAFARSRLIRSFTPVPLHWGASPAFICYEWVDGKQLWDDLEPLDASEAGPRIKAVSRQAGQLLRHYHESFADSIASHAVEGSVGRQRSTARRLAEVIGPPHRTPLVRSLGDSGPHNIIVEADGNLRLIDLPTSVVITYPEFDVARLALRISRRTEATMHPSWLPNLRLQDTILQAVLQGYYERRESNYKTVSLIYAAQASETMARTISRLKSHPFEISAALREGLRGIAFAARSIKSRRNGKKAK